MTRYFTPGEPAGIGPDLLLQHAAGPGLPDDLLAVTDPALLHARARRLGLQVRIIESDRPGHADRGTVRVWPVPLTAPVKPGQLDPANAFHVIACLERATDACRADPGHHALVTGPVHKGVINDAGLPFTGHTEWLAARTGGHPVMMLACPGLRVALATTHLPLRQVADALTEERLERVLRILYHDLQQRFGLGRPHILVCGLNPHAGEGGHLGHEEQTLLIPLLERLRREGMALEGPLPADTLFTPHHLDRADAVLAMYHDQGLPVLKHLGFGHAVNITLGLPLIRTSVDHGTALELAGSGRAHTGSFMAALDTAAQMLSSGS